MLFENITVDRITIHEIHRRLDDRRAIPPNYGKQLLTLDPEAMDFFRERIVAAMGSQSQSMEMEIITPLQANSAIEIAQQLHSGDDQSFIEQSKNLTDRLVTAQTSRAIPGGIVVVFSGTAGNPARTMVGVIKAETHSGFRPTDELEIQYLNDLFLGPQTKLYKIGIFIYDGENPAPALPGGWRTMVYDNHMTSTNRDGAAQYFYEAFLGCRLPKNSAQLTKKFYEGTRDFINKTEIPEEKKADLLTGLYTYLKVDQTPTLELKDFTARYLSDDLSDDYQQYMKLQDFPTNAVPKDTTDIQGYLRRRKLSFSRNIQLVSPPDAFKELIKVQSIEGEEDENENKPEWTQIIVRDRIRDQT